MATIDPEQERQRLVQHYAGLPDESLLQLAEDPASLTEVAQQALAAEIGRRQLSPMRDKPSQLDIKPHTVTPERKHNPLITPVERYGLVTVGQFRDLPAALLAKGALDSAGIEAFLIDDNMVRMDWFISNLLGGIKLQVRPEDADAAMDVLENDIPEGFEVEGLGDYEQPRCPKCGSVDITFEALNKPIAYTSAYVGMPLPVPRDSWKCEACGQRWKDMGESGE